ncbi:hypothetical protein [Photobacterium leiognathi]|uniref:hypothetical protein n=1 Tax=Photobacterium leiognathi TaxID=553611 RepID=UPI0027395DC8|nr:hypothetical protein [Photobacterium leiognathi]
MSLSICLIGFNSYARKDCPVAIVDNIQVEGSYVLYHQSGVWRRLGVLTDVGTKERFSALLSAHMAGKKIMVSYMNNSFNCNETNYKENAFIVRTYKD